MKVLIAGPCISEFGWELMEWQGYVRALAPRFNQVITCSTAAHQPLYADYKATFIGHCVSGTRDCHTMREISNPDEWQRVMRILQDYDCRFKKDGHYVEWRPSRPAKGAVGIRRPITMQKFIRFGTSQQDQYDIIIHARNRPVRFATEGHNYPIELWLRLIELLKKHGFERIAAIGTKEQAFAPAGSLDFRGIAMEQLMNMMASTRMVIGPSSGPIHLASLCGTPHVVWARGRASARVDQRNKERYESYWNPLKTPVTVILHRNEEPPVDPARILACVLEMNARIHK